MSRDNMSQCLCRWSCAVWAAPHLAPASFCPLVIAQLLKQSSLMDAGQLRAWGMLLMFGGTATACDVDASDDRETASTGRSGAPAVNVDAGFSDTPSSPSDQDDHEPAPVAPPVDAGGVDASHSNGGSTAEPSESSDTDAGSPALPVAPEAYEWRLPPGFPLPLVPENNPMTTAKVELGRHLFYDKRLSNNQTQSCASCHLQELAFTDGRATALGSTQEAHPRGSMSLANLAYAASLTWANPLFAMGVVPEPLERQTLLPLYGDSPVELGLRSQASIESRLHEVPQYRAWFAAAFPAQTEPVTAQNIGRALAAFERTLISGRSAFDRFHFDGDDTALSAASKRGYELFTGDRLSCSQCHAGFNFTDHVGYRGSPKNQQIYHNTGLYNIDGAGAYPEPNTGIYNVTEDPKQMGMFKAPTLRNIAVTAPYMHDGSIAALSEVLDHYAAGGRTIASGPNRGVGSASPLKDPLVHGFTLTAQERADVLEFLESLTDEEFLANPAFADPGSPP
jgi:cytochrome c peroxidase